MRRCELEPWDGERSRRSSGADDDLVRLKAGSAVAFDGVGVGKPRRSGLLVYLDTSALEIVSHQRTLAGLLGHVMDPIEEPAIVQ